MKTAINLLLGLALALTMLTGCNYKHTVLGPTNPETPTTTTVTNSVDHYIYGNSFNGRANWELLLESCGRCGDEKVGSDGSYTKYWRWNWFGDDPRECRDLAKYESYIQIKFASRQLPTTATVHIQARPSAPFNNAGAIPFIIKGQARAINENEGFEIYLTQSDGSGGGYPLRIWSENENHVKGNHAMNIKATYRNEILSTKIVRLAEPTIPENSGNTCLEYSF